LRRLLHTLAASVLAVALSASAPSALAQEEPGPATPVLDDVVQAVEATYKDVEALQAHFEQTVATAGMEQQRSEGEVLLQRPRKMRWDFTGPEGSLFVTDGVEMWVYTRHLKQAIQYKELSQAASSIAPIELQDLESLRDKWNVEVSTEEGSRKNNLVLILTPKEQGRFPIKQVRLELTRKYVLETVAVTDSLDNLTTLRFTQVRLNPVVSDGSFSFEPPADVEVIVAEGL